MLMEKSHDMKSRPGSPIELQRRRVATMDEHSSEPIPDVIASRVRNEFAFGPFTLCVAGRSLKRGGEALSVGSRAFDLLIVLVERAGEVISHRELIARAWPDITVENANLRVHIAGLRKVLGDGLDGARYISNVAGRGYCFVAAVAHCSMERTPQHSDGIGITFPAAVEIRLNDETVTARGQSQAGPGLLWEALKALCSEQHNTALTAVASVLVQGLLTAGQFDEVPSIINSAIGQGASFHITELLRLKAEMLATALQHDYAAAMDCLKDSLRFAREQSALAYELRSATTRARLLAERGQREEAKSILAPAYARFTETEDLRDARALLVSLA